jgi:hypothetical protein
MAAEYSQRKNILPEDRPREIPTREIYDSVLGKWRDETPSTHESVAFLRGEDLPIAPAQSSIAG